MPTKEDVAIVMRAGTAELASDLARAASMLRTWAKDVEKTGSKSLAVPVATAPLKAAIGAVRGIGSAAKGTVQSLKGVANAASLPFKAMAAGAGGGALADPIIAATAAVDTLAAAVEVPFKVAAAAAQGAAAIIKLPFELAAGAAEGLGHIVGGVFGMIPKVGEAVGGIFKGIGTVAAKTLSAVGGVAAGIVGAFGHAAGAVGELFGKALGGIGRLAIQTFAGVAGVVKDSIIKAADLEQTTLAFEVMLSSAERAQEMVAGIRKFAATTPFNSEETTQAARGLLAYGVAADQVIPTIRMLGDVSATFGKDLPLSRLTYLYGTLFAQQRAYTVDIKQFAMAGIPIWEELGKVMGKSTDELRQMVEEGRIGRDEITKAFLSMTQAGGRFAGMTERQADTIHGLWEAASDAFAQLKTQFGQMVVEESGLKDVFKDTDSFAKRMGEELKELRPLVRFIADLGKAVVQVGWEFLHAGAKAIGFAKDAVTGTFPEAKKAVEDFHTTLKNAANFKIDATDVAGWVFDFGERFLRVTADIIEGIGGIGSAIQRSIVKPIEEGIGKFQELRRWWLDNSPVASPKASPELRYRLPMAGDSDADIVERARGLHAAWTEEMGNVAKNREWLAGVQRNPGASAKHIREAEKLVRDAEDRLKPLADLHLKWFGQTFDVGGDEAGRMLLQEGKVPPRKSEGSLLTDIDNWTKGAAGVLRGKADITHNQKEPFLESLRQNQAAREAAKLAEETKKASDAISLFRNRAGGPLMMGPLNELAGAVGTATQGFSRDSGLRGFLAGFSPATAALPSFLQQPTGVRIQGDFPQNLLDLEKHLKEEYRPLNIGPNVKSLDDALRGTKLGRELADIDALRGRPGIDESLIEDAKRAAVMRVGERFHVGTPPQLAGAAIAGSQEDARLLTQFMAGGTQNKRQTTDDILRQILAAIQATAKNTKEIADAPQPQLVDFFW